MTPDGGLSPFAFWALVIILPATIGWVGGMVGDWLKRRSDR